MDQLSELAERLADEAEPVEALRRWLHANVRLVATKKGMVAALALAAHRPSELHAYSSDRLTKAVGSLLDRAAKAGEIRADITPEDLLRALVGMSYNVYDTPDWRKTALRLADIFVDGPAQALTRAPRRQEQQKGREYRLRPSRRNVLSARHQPLTE